jgi:ketosteroid isomerase-like protein
MKQASDFTLSWRPAVNDVAAAADLGYSSGPWTITDKSKAGRPPVYGTFLSIWRKQSNGKWRVIVDMGVRVRTPTDEHGQQKWNASTLPAIAMQGAEPTKEAWSLLELDRQFSDEAGTAGLAASYRTYAFSDARILRENIGALSSVENREKVLTTEDSSGKYAWLPLRSEVSSSADFGYTFGSYIVTPTDEAKPSAKGYYARVWRRDASRAWKVVAETLKEQPAPKN